MSCKSSCKDSCAESSCDCESVCQHTPCKLNQSEQEHFLLEVSTDIAKVAIEYCIAIEQTKAAKAKYHAKLALFDSSVAKAKKKKLSKIAPCNEAMVYFKEELSEGLKLTEEEKAKVTKFEQTTFKGMTVNDFTEEEYSQYVMLRKKTNYLKHKLGKTVGKYLVLPS